MFVKLARAVGNGRRNVLMGPAIGEHQGICMIKHAARRSLTALDGAAGGGADDLLGDQHVWSRARLPQETKQWQQLAEAKHLAVMAAASSNSSPLTFPLRKTAPNWFMIVATSVCFSPFTRDSIHSVASDHLCWSKNDY